MHKLSMNFEQKLSNFSCLKFRFRFDVILNNLQKLDIINDETKQDTKSTADNSTEPKSSNQKSLVTKFYFLCARTYSMTYRKHRLFQALTFSEENYQNSHQDETNV